MIKVSGQIVSIPSESPNLVLLIGVSLFFYVSGKELVNITKPSGEIVLDGVNLGGCVCSFSMDNKESYVIHMPTTGSGTRLITPIETILKMHMFKNKEEGAAFQSSLFYGASIVDALRFFKV